MALQHSIGLIRVLQFIQSVDAHLDGFPVGAILLQLMLLRPCQCLCFGEQLGTFLSGAFLFGICLIELLYHS